MTPSVILLLAALGAGAEPAPAAYPADAAPAALLPAVERAKAAAQALQGRLQPRLAKALESGSPADAVKACREDAPRLTAAAATEQRLGLGRTSDRLRNGASAAPAWAAPHVAAAAAKKATEVKPVVVDLGAKVGVLLPIAVAPTCLKCHGHAEAIAPEVRRAIEEAFPGDRATGYAAGDHRGFFWAEVPRS